MWRSELGRSFAGLHPERIDEYPAPMTGRIVGSDVGDLRLFQVTGTPQIVRRTARVARYEPTEALKVCLQVRGRATVHQDGREIVIEPGQLGVYDTSRPYDLRLEGAWESAVMVFPPDALQLPQRWITEVMEHVHDASSGAGPVLSYFVSSAIAQSTPESSGASSTLRLAEAGLQLLCSTVTAQSRTRTTDNLGAQRLAVFEHIRHHLRNPQLTHRSVAHSQNMSSRSLDRLFQGEPRTVSTTIRELRLDCARRDLLDPRSAHTTVGAIAARWCLNDAAHFSRVYKQRFGASPSAERNAALGGPDRH
nr:helix-turn-helix domain-containing protein [Rhodococcus sp. (in: high G+C Gram-positive bacteria)]